MTNNRKRVKNHSHKLDINPDLDEAAIEEYSTTQASDIENKLQATTDSSTLKHDLRRLCRRCESQQEQGKCKASGAKYYNSGKRNHYTKMCCSSGV